MANSKPRAPRKSSGVTADYMRYQMRETEFNYLSASGVDLKTIIEISGHSQASTLLTSYVHATSESVKNSLSIQDKNRPTAEMLKELEIDRRLEKWIQQANPVGQDLRKYSLLRDKRPIEIRIVR